MEYKYKQLNSLHSQNYHTIPGDTCKQTDKGLAEAVQHSPFSYYAARNIIQSQLMDLNKDMMCWQGTRGSIYG